MLFFRLISYLPFPLLYALSDFLYLTVYKTLGYRKKVVLNNLIKSFPDKSEKEIKTLMDGFYKHLCDLVVESLKLLTISEKEIRNRLQIKDLEVALSKMHSGKSIIAVCGHTGNWEWLLQACALNCPFPIDAVYKPLSNIFFDKLMLKIRTRFGAEPLPMKNVGRSIIKNKNQVRGIAMVADQTPPRDEIQYWTNFLNQDTPWFVGQEKIARMADMPVVFVGMTKIKRGYYSVYFKDMSNSLESTEEYQLIKDFSKKLEENIKTDPTNWLWSHRRWKHSR